METLSKIFNSINDNLSERLKNPFFSSFFISWIIINYKIWFFLMFDGAAFLYKEQYIDKWSSEILNVLIYPFISALTYTLLLPVISLKLDELLKINKIKRNAIKLEIKEEKLKRKLSIAATQRKIEEEISGANEMSQLRNTNKTLNAELTKLKEQVADLTEKNTWDDFSFGGDSGDSAFEQKIKGLKENGLFDQFLEIAEQNLVEHSPYAPSLDGNSKKKIYLLENFDLVEKLFDGELDEFRGNYTVTEAGKGLFNYILKKDLFKSKK
ncbi:hypothetical protein [Marivirga arenosa]|uniref:Uncharacterized protein n=1 Tax=Marivirga arenosa TaxID=3059076 RepID=A0AA49GCD7_9BACT|nr:hypothetical protein [Marivirga sp. BKB1-2]WKK79554.2 hypothetical protein QYS47_19540 [Marivirga sp. BKB1-2]